MRTATTKTADGIGRQPVLEPVGTFFGSVVGRHPLHAVAPAETRAALAPRPRIASARATAKTPPDLADAIARIARGDAAAFEMVYASTSRKLYGIVVRIVKRRELADDVLQDVYLRVWQRAGDYDPACSSPITWLATIARNRALDEAKRKTTQSLDDCPAIQHLPSDDDPLASLEQNEAWRRLHACIDLLEPERREIILLVYHHGMTREEIAQRIGRPVSTVKTWLRRSLAQLKGHLENDGRAVVEGRKGTELT